MSTTALPDPKTLNGYQLRGWSCALCGARLYRDRLVGTVADPLSGEPAELWACAPECLPRPWKRRAR